MFLVYVNARQRGPSLVCRASRRLGRSNVESTPLPRRPSLLLPSRTAERAKDVLEAILSTAVAIETVHRDGLVGHDGAGMVEFLSSVRQYRQLPLPTGGVPCSKARSVSPSCPARSSEHDALTEAASTMPVGRAVGLGSMSGWRAASQVAPWLCQPVSVRTVCPQGR